MLREIENVTNGNPARAGGFHWIEDRRQLTGHVKNKRRDDQVTADPAARDGVRQIGLDGLTGKLNTAFLLELAQGGVQQVRIFGIAAAAGERPVARPGVSFPLRAADEQDGVLGLGRPENRDCCFRLVHGSNHYREIAPLEWRGASIPRPFCVLRLAGADAAGCFL